MQRRKGFTLTELLVVISIIVLVIVVLVPSIKAMTGDRSIPLAQNRLGALLAVARESAINSNSPTGLAIYPDVLSTGDTITAFVQVNTYTSGLNVVQYLDVIPNSEQTLLQRGVTAEIIMGVPGSQQRYTPIGVILFDAQGHLMTYPILPTIFGPPGATVPTQLSQAFQVNQSAAANSIGTPTGVGIALVDTETYKNQITSNSSNGWTDAGLATTYSTTGVAIGGWAAVSTTSPLAPGTPGNPILWGPTVTPFQGLNANGNASGEALKDIWIDSNAAILMVNPSSGSLVVAK
jgi:prepilin-type N-terminal cleavage/methylation domain-containing protein